MHGTNNVLTLSDAGRSSSYFGRRYTHDGITGCYHVRAHINAKLRCASNVRRFDCKDCGGRIGEEGYLRLGH